MGVIGASVSLIDGRAGGRYLGKRLAVYISGMKRLLPQRASFAAAFASQSLLAIDVALVFLLTTDLWI